MELSIAQILQNIILRDVYSGETIITAFIYLLHRPFSLKIGYLSNHSQLQDHAHLETEHDFILFRFDQLLRNNISSYVEHQHRNFSIFCLWCCPLKLSSFIPSLLPPQFNVSNNVRILLMTKDNVLIFSPLFTEVGLKICPANSDVSRCLIQSSSANNFTLSSVALSQTLIQITILAPQICFSQSSSFFFRRVTRRRKMRRRRVTLHKTLKSSQANAIQQYPRQAQNVFLF